MKARGAVGYPLLVKAAGGGGGIGMRRVDGAEKLIETVAATQSMAAKSFGNGAIFLERFVPKARHVEIQVFGFGNGDAVHLFERDCSLQRRFQKVIEESPAPGLPEQVRRAMAKAAVDLCRATRYAAPGTVEFIVDAESFEFFFLEMNTRIQVEHAVTEMITGRDLVAMQIELARGVCVRISQDEIRRAAMPSNAGSMPKIPPRCSCRRPGRSASSGCRTTSEGVRDGLRLPRGRSGDAVLRSDARQDHRSGGDRDTARRGPPRRLAPFRSTVSAPIAIFCCPASQIRCSRRRRPYRIYRCATEAAAGRPDATSLRRRGNLACSSPRPG